MIKKIIKGIATGLTGLLIFTPALAQDKNCKVLSLRKPHFYKEDVNYNGTKLNIDTSVVDYLKWIGIGPSNPDDTNLYEARKGIFEKVFKGVEYTGTRQQNIYLNAILDSLTLRRAPPLVEETNTGLTDEQLNLRYLAGPSLWGCFQLK